jgi:hypothetical protein
MIEILGAMFLIVSVVLWELGSKLFWLMKCEGVEVLDTISTILRGQFQRPFVSYEFSMKPSRGTFESKSMRWKDHRTPLRRVKMQTLFFGMLMVSAPSKLCH